MKSQQMGKIVENKPVMHDHFEVILDSCINQ